MRTICSRWGYLKPRLRNLENGKSKFKSKIEATRSMKLDTAITDTIFAAFLQCATKAYLLRDGDSGTQNDLSNWQWDHAGKFRWSALERLKSSVRESECYTGAPSPRILEQGLYQLVVDPMIALPNIQTQPDALWRTHPNSGASYALYSPLRFVRREKLSINDKLILAFDALVIFHVTGKMPRNGKIIHGAHYAVVTVPLATNPVVK